jgi:photosynthetic reaction center cytochrome c subunit
MKVSFRRLIFAGVVLLSITTLLAVNGTHLPVVFAQTAAKPQLSEQAFKNIQVLKGITVDDFMGTMGLFSAALSVCCGDCHTGAGTSDPKWDDDAPPKKKVARRMIAMVNTINKENFGGRTVITCWTCHRGAESPAQTPPIDTVYAASPNFVPPDILPAAPPKTSGTPSADEILDKYIQALGGADQLAKLTSYRLKGSSLLFGAAGGDPAEILAKAPGNIALEVHQKEGEMARTSNGREAWVVLPLTVVKEYPLTSSALEGAKLVGEMAFPGRIKQYLTNWKVSYPTTIDGKDVYVVQGSGPSGLLATFYFDKQSGLLNRMVYYFNSAMGRVPTQIDYSDYRAVAGVKLPFKWTYGWVSGQEQYAFTDAEPNAVIADSAFAKPAGAQK